MGNLKHSTTALMVAALFAVPLSRGLAQAPAPGQQAAAPGQAQPAATPPQFPTLPAPTKDKPALSVPPPLYTTTPPQDKQFAFERIFNYRIMKYQPAIVIQRLTRDSASNATPEQALASQVSAMLAGDREWWMSNWDAASQKFHKERDLQMNRSAADWRAIWDRALRGQQVRLVNRVVTGPFGPYVMLQYELHDAGGKVTLTSNFVSKEEAGRWVATLDLSEDPLFHYFDLGKDRVSVTER